MGERVEMVELLKRAAAKVSAVPAPLVERAAQSIVEGKLDWAADSDIGVWRREALERSRDLTLIKSAVGTDAVPAKAVEEAVAPLERVLNWLSTNEAVEWRQTLEKRADAVAAMRAALAADGVRADVLEAGHAKLAVVVLGGEEGKGGTS